MTAIVTTNLPKVIGEVTNTGIGRGVVSPPYNPFGEQREGYVANASLRHEEHIRYSEALIDVARIVLNGVEHLRQANLIVPVGGLGVILSMWERVDGGTPATANMHPSVEGEDFNMSFDEVGVPIPIISKPWGLGIRQLESSRQRGEALSVTKLRTSTRVVSEKLEDMLFNGEPSIVVDTKTIYGYKTFPSRNTYNIDNAWTDRVNRTILEDVVGMTQVMLNDKIPGPYVLYIPRSWWSELHLDYSTESGGKTFIQRIKELPDIQGVYMSDKLTDEILLISLTQDTIDWASAQDLINVEWSNNPFNINYLNYAAGAPRPKSDKVGNCGIVHGTVVV